MKSATTYDEIAIQARFTFVGTDSLTAAVSYCKSARRDEALGFTLTAAMEWQRAAELFVADCEAADCCWQQWERIMGIPRSLAQPIEETSAAPAVAPASELAAAA